MFCLCPLRLWIAYRIHKNESFDGDKNVILIAFTEFLKVVLFTAIFIIMRIEMKNSSESCWDHLSGQYFNWILMFFIVLGPTLCTFFVLLFIICLLPVAIYDLYIHGNLDFSSSNRQTSQIIATLSKREYNPQ